MTIPEQARCRLSQAPQPFGRRARPPGWWPSWSLAALVLGLAWIKACATSSEPESTVGAPTGSLPQGQAGTPQTSNPTTAQCQLGSCPSAPVMDDGTLTVSFSRDLLATLQRNCSDVPCHGNAQNPAGQLYMGPSLPTVVTVEQMLAPLVNVSSKSAPALKLIEPGDPARSFFMIKVAGCQNQLGLTCTPLAGAVGDGSCGDTMPQSQRPLCNRERELLALWILQGAQAN